MKIASIVVNAVPRLALELNGMLFDIATLAKEFGEANLQTGLSDLITQVIECPENQVRIQGLLDQLLTVADQSSLAISEEVTWLPPVRRPGKILCVAMNNSASNERKISAPEHPAFFLKPASCLIGHNETIEVRDYYGSVHPEPELALIIGKRVKDISADDAWDAVYGYTIFNDITGNDMRAEDCFHYYALYPKENNPDELERREQHLSYAARYKGTDSFGPMGPWVVTADDVPNPHALRVRCWHRGELIAEDSTAYMNYNANEIIAFISRYQTLEPGDVISLGTAFRKKKGARRSLHLANITKLGGPVSVEIEGIGRLDNPVKKIDV